MTTRFRLVPGGVEEAQFRRVPEGWLFTILNPWVFGPQRTYVVSDAQKPGLAERVRRSRYIRLMLLVPVALVMATAFIMFPSSLNVRSVQAWLVWGALVVLITGAIALSDYLTVRPLLRDLPRSSQKTRLTDMLARQGEAMSVRALAILTLIFSIGTANQTYQALTSVRLGALAAIGAAAFAWLAFNYGVMLLCKLQTRSNSSSETSSSIGEPDLTIDRSAVKLNAVRGAPSFVAGSIVGLMVL